MALNSIAIPADAARDAKAAELMKTAHLWHIVTLRKPFGSFKVGDSFLLTPNGYRCNTVACECQDYRRGHICKHVRVAVKLDAQNTAKNNAPTDQEVAALAESRMQASVSDLIPVGWTAISQEERIIEAEQAARWRAEEDAPRKGYAAIMDAHGLTDAF
jgi:hypothetical protein